MKNEDLKVSFGLGDEVKILEEFGSTGIVADVRPMPSRLRYTVVSLIACTYKSRHFYWDDLALHRRANVESLAHAFSMLGLAMDFSVREGPFSSFAIGDVVRLNEDPDKAEFWVSYVGTRAGNLIYSLACGVDYFETRIFNHGELILVRRASQSDLNRATTNDRPQAFGFQANRQVNVEATSQDRHLNAYLVKFHYFVSGDTYGTVLRVPHTQVMYGMDSDQILLQVRAFRLYQEYSVHHPEDLTIQPLMVL